MLWVRPGVLDVRARAFRCSKEFSSDDFPTFDLPRNEISGRSSRTQSLRSNALLTNSAETTFISKIINQCGPYPEMIVCVRVRHHNSRMFCTVSLLTDSGSAAPYCLSSSRDLVEYGPSRTVFNCSRVIGSGTRRELPQQPQDNYRDLNCGVGKIYFRDHAFQRVIYIDGGECGG